MFPTVSRPHLQMGKWAGGEREGDSRLPEPQFPRLQNGAASVSFARLFPAIKSGAAYTALNTGPHWFN